MSQKKPNILNSEWSDSYFSTSDKMFASFICKQTGNNSRQNMTAYALAANRSGQGHVCVDLDIKALSSALKEAGISDTSPGDIIKALKDSPAVGNTDSKLPLIMPGEKYLYLKKFWDHQEKIVSFINSGNKDLLPVDNGHLTQLAEKYFSPLKKEYDWQMGAAICAASNRFSVITGGPGTGKTTTAARILCILTEMIEMQSGRKPRIFVAAPTGKAAARISSSISKALHELNDKGIACSINIENSCTIHRLLGIGHNTYRPRFNENEKLPADVLLIDEASMIDMAMMSSIMSAMKKGARLILMGDKDQLASVEPGAVLADICSAGPAKDFSSKAAKNLKLDPNHPGLLLREYEGFFDGVVELCKSYRFSENSGIGLLAFAVKEQNSTKASEILSDSKYNDIEWTKSYDEKSLKKILKNIAGSILSETVLSDDPEKALKMMDEFRILCSVRQGPSGTENINELMRLILHEMKLAPGKGDWYHGRQIMITQNDYQLGLFNGDTGIAMREDGHKRNLKIFFRTGNGEIKAIHPSRLGKHETVYATTVHKSQGSEFDKVVFLLPDKDSEAVAMELAYTAITRAKKEFVLIGQENIFVSAINRRTKRTSGLKDRLLGLI